MTREISSVVLADDDSDDRDFFCAAMNRVYSNVKVLTFEDGDVLLEYLNHCTEAMLPCLVVLDYKMPRLPGPQFLRVTGSGTRFTSIPKIVWSTSQLKKDVEECLAAGALRFYIKPITDDQVDNLLKSLEHWIDPQRKMSSSPA